MGKTNIEPGDKFQDKDGIIHTCLEVQENKGIILSDEEENNYDPFRVYYYTFPINECTLILKS